MVFIQEKLIEELTKAVEKNRKESELTIFDCHIGGLETRLKYFRTGRDITVNIKYFLIIVNCIKNSTPLIFSARRNCWAA